MSENNSYTKVSHTSWSSRIGKSFQGIGLGLVLIATATGLLYWNEGRAVRTGDAIGEAQRITVSMPSATTVDPAFNGKLVHVSGRATTTDVVADPLFTVQANAISVERKVQYYQWTENSKSETRQKLGGSEETVTTYSYEQKWVDKPVDSQNFHQPAGHRNTIKFQAENARWYAPQVQLGAYRLPEFLVHSMGGAVPLDTGLGEQERKSLQKQLIPDSSTFNSNQTDGVSTAVPPGQAPMVHVQGNTLYLGRNMHQPRIGDVKVMFFSVPQAEVSIIARVIGNTFEPFLATNGSTFSRLSMGTLSMDNMFQHAKDANTTITWLVRGVSILLAIGGFKALLGPLQVLASVIPPLGSVVGAGAGLVSALLGVAWSLVIIAIAWLRFRPILSIGLLAVALALLALLFFKGKKTKTA
ncbi:MAG: TMEM43 family protein [Desulfobulbus sp.]